MKTEAVFITTFFIFLLFAIDNSAAAQTATSTTELEQTASSTPALSPEGFLLAKVNEAKTLLENIKVTYKTYTASSIYKKKRVYIKMLKRDVAVIGLNQNSGELKTFVFKEDFPFYGKDRPNPKPPDVLAEKDDCKLLWRDGSRWGFNRDLLLKCGDDDLNIVGLKMPYAFVDSSGKSQILTDFYIPYSPELHTKTFAKMGKGYLEDLISRAGQDLTEKEVYSRAFPDKTVNEIMPSEFLMSLILNEHMDHGDFNQALKDGSFPELVEKVWVIIGLNQEKSMRWSISSAGACCLTQFMPKTYQMIVKRYPDAELKSNVTEGRQDHLNAVKASMVLFDSDISLGWKDKTKLTCFSSLDMLQKCLAASYNAGPGTLNKVVKSLGARWESGPARQNKYAARLRSETITYLKKLGTIKDYLASAIGF